MKGISGLLFIVVSYCLIGQVDSKQIDKEMVKKLIDKIDSVHIKEREEALNELKKMAQDDEKVMELLKFESEKESNSYNARFFLKKLIKDIEESKNKSQLDEKESSDNASSKQESGRGGAIEQKVELSQSGISISLCRNNKCRRYEASSCKELLQKYPKLKGKIKCDNNGVAFEWRHRNHKSDKAGHGGGSSRGNK